MLISCVAEMSCDAKSVQHVNCHMLCHPQAGWTCGYKAENHRPLGLP